MKIKDPTFTDVSGDSMLGPYVAYEAVTSVGVVSYGTDGDRTHWYAAPMGTVNSRTAPIFTSSLDAAREKAITAYQRAVLSHPVVKLI